MAPPWQKRCLMKYGWLSGVMFSISHTRLAVLNGRRRHSLSRITQIVSNVTPFPSSHMHTHVLHFPLLWYDLMQICHINKIFVPTFPFCKAYLDGHSTVIFPIPLIAPKFTHIYFKRENICFETNFKLYGMWIFPILQISLVNGLAITGGFQHKIWDIFLMGGTWMY